MPREIRTSADLPAETQARLAAEQMIRDARAWLATNRVPTPAEVDTFIEAAFPDPGHTAQQRTYLKRLGKAVLYLVRTVGAAP